MTFRLFHSLLSPFLFVSSLLSIAPNAIAKEVNPSKLKPATMEDQYLYRWISTNYFCNARLSKIEFPKALGIASATYVQVLKSRHNAFVDSAGTKKLTDNQLFNGVGVQIVDLALEFCPKEVPKKERKKVENAIKKIQLKNKKK